MTDKSRTEIVAQNLETANASGGYDHEDEGIIQSKIMYNTPITSAQLKEYLKVLIERDLLSFDSTRRRFKTTQKGRRFLEIYNEMGNVMEEQQQI